MNVDWRLVRDQFSLDRDYAHLSQFYIVSHPKTARDAIERHRRAIDENPFLATERGMFGTDAQKRLPKVYEVAARYTGGRPEEIALVPNTITGLARVPRGALHTPVSRAWSAGVVCFDVAGLAPDEVVDKLLEKKIIASITPYQQPCARLSAGIMNDEAEVDRALAAVAELANARRMAV